MFVLNTLPTYISESWPILIAVTDLKFNYSDNSVLYFTSKYLKYLFMKLWQIR
jgi:hypothetical protein